jgi:hypothetical protein
LVLVSRSIFLQQLGCYRTLSKNKQTLVIWIFTILKKSATYKSLLYVAECQGHEDTVWNTASRHWAYQYSKELSGKFCSVDTCMISILFCCASVKTFNKLILMKNPHKLHTD